MTPADDPFWNDMTVGAQPPSHPLPTPTLANRSPPTKATGKIWLGIGMMVLAVIWFVGGLFINRIFFYPSILFIMAWLAS